MSPCTDALVALAASVAVHAVLFLTSLAWFLTSSAEVLVARGETSIEISFAPVPRSPETPVIPELKRPDVPDPAPARPEFAPLRPDDILIPRHRPADAAPGPQPIEDNIRPRPPADIPPPQAAADDSLRGARRARTAGQARPTYPEYCRFRGIEGTVKLLIDVLPSGRAGSVTVDRTSGSWRLDRAAVRFYRDVARYLPARRFGKAIRSTLAVNVRFELTGEERRATEIEPGP